MTVCHIDKVLICSQGVGNRLKSGRIVRLKPRLNPLDQQLQPSLMTTQDIVVAEELPPVSTQLI